MTLSKMHNRILLIDNYDSFTYMLKDYIEQCGVSCVVKRNDDIDTSIVSQYDAIVISPGPKAPKEAGALMEVLSQYHQTKPILGICLGHQAIGEFFGAHLIKSQYPKHGKVETVTHNHHTLFEGINQEFLVTRYHSLILEKVVSPLNVIAQSAKMEVMALAHNHLPIYGIQFHPESCMTEGGLQIIKNFLQLAKQLA
jgi:anthranilate synthase component 2